MIAFFVADEEIFGKNNLKGITNILHSCHIVDQSFHHTMVNIEDKAHEIKILLESTKPLNIDK